MAQIDGIDGIEVRLLRHPGDSGCELRAMRRPAVTMMHPPSAVRTFVDIHVSRAWYEKQRTGLTNRVKRAVLAKPRGSLRIHREEWLNAAGTEELHIQDFRYLFGKALAVQGYEITIEPCFSDGSTNVTWSRKLRRRQRKHYGTSSGAKAV